MRTGWVLGCLLIAALSAPGLDAQVELDRIVGRAGDHIITQSDVRQARTLKLVEDASSDAAVQRELENRALELADASRSAPPPATDADLAARRQAWEARVGGTERAAALLAGAHMSDAQLLAWFRDDATIDAYLTRQFGRLPPAEREQAVAGWLARLRQRSQMSH
jgi:hypothetical protein